MAPGPATEEKLRSLFVGPSLPVVTVSLTTPARPLPSQGPAVLTFPPRCPFAPLISGAKSPPWCSLRGGQPNSPGISCHCGQEPRHCLLPGQSQHSGAHPRPQVGPRELREAGKGTQISSVAELGTAPKTPGTWAMGSPWADAQAGRSALLPALWVTLACPLFLWAPSLRPWLMADPAQAQQIKGMCVTRSLSERLGMLGWPSTVGVRGR